MSKANLVRTLLICCLAVMTASVLWGGQEAAVGSAPMAAVSQPAQKTASPSLDALRALIFQAQPTDQDDSCDCQALRQGCDDSCYPCGYYSFSCSPSTCSTACYCYPPDYNCN